MAPVQSVGDNVDIYSRQVILILIIICICCLISVLLFCAGVSSDREEMGQFYSAFLLRQLLIREGLLQYRAGGRAGPHGWVEDQPAEWAGLDYSHQLPRPPATLLQFLPVWCCSRYYPAWSQLFSQFRAWKRLKRRQYNIVVTQRSKKEMANAEKAAQKQLNQRTKLEHAKSHRKACQEN